LREGLFSLCLFVGACARGNGGGVPVPARSGTTASVGVAQPRAETPGATQKPLYALSEPCQDRRYPRLSGPWAVGCGPLGLVDRALDLRSGVLVELEGAVEAPGVGRGVLFAVGWKQGLWRLPNPKPEGSVVTATTVPLAPPAVDARRAALVLDGRVTSFNLDDRSLLLHEAHPMPWYPPALAEGFTAWVDGGDRASSGLDVWVLAPGKHEKPEPLAHGPGDQRHVTGDGFAFERGEDYVRKAWIGWCDETGVHVEDMIAKRESFYAADTCFRAGLTLWGPVVCWEERADGGVGVRCSDGLSTEAPGDAGWPSRDGPWLLFRGTDEVPILATADQLVLDDDDDRASGGGERVAGGWGGHHASGTVSFDFPWSAPDWCADVWDRENGRWTPSSGDGKLDVQEGVAHVVSPGDAVRLRPVLGKSCEALP
jgi:hypothetical protein